MAQEKSFLTEKQLKILELRARGYKQREIAEILGTTRENIAILEKRARENVKKARRTIIAFEKLSPVRVSLEEGEDIFAAPEKILRAADKHGIKVVHNKTSLIGLLRRRGGNRVMGNRIARKIEVNILRSGRVIVE
ncbi:Tfx family DNA-binding protein [Candidatus Pyrohabitans sp.]